MARVEITFWKAGQNAVYDNAVLPVGRLDGAITEVITSGAASKTSTLKSPADGFARIYADGDIWICAGAIAAVPAPTGAGMRVPAGSVVDVAISKGSPISVIDA